MQQAMEGAQAPSPPKIATPRAYLPASVGLGLSPGPALQKGFEDGDHPQLPRRRSLEKPS